VQPLTRAVRDRQAQRRTTAIPALDTATIRARSRAFGFDAVGVTTPCLAERDRHNLAAYLAEGRHGDMRWLADRAAMRGDPGALWPEARSVICLGLNYGPREDPLAVLAESDRGAISVYARGRDYHRVLKTRLKAFAGWLVARYGGAVKVFADTAPVMEKPLAARAGLGWIGKHTNLVSRDFGSWLFLGELFTTLPLAPDPPAADRCGRCSACIEACPTRAITAPYRLDPRRCLSYLTIEHKGAIGGGLVRALGNRVFGCDDCLAVCPWNKFARPTAHAELSPRPDLIRPPLAELATLDEQGFRTQFAGTAVRRTGRGRFVRNVAHALANAGGAVSPSLLERLGDDRDPLVAAAAVPPAADQGPLPDDRPAPPGR
jgi:epoxyqueuosine reductase